MQRDTLPTQPAALSPRHERGGQPAGKQGRGEATMVAMAPHTRTAQRRLAIILFLEAQVDLIHLTSEGKGRPLM